MEPQMLNMQRETPPKGFPWRVRESVPSCNGGFSLMELMVVVAIIAILALGAAGISRNPITDVKSAIFNLRSDLSYARAEAAKRNTTVLVEFDSDMDDGFSYKICIENYAIFNAPNRDNDCDDVNADADEDEEDFVLKEVAFSNGIVEFFDNAPAVNPGVRPNGVPPGAPGGVWPAVASADPDGPDGLTFPENDNLNDYITMLPDGSCDAGGVVYLYVRNSGDGGANLRTPPLALVVSMPGVMRIWRWDGTAWTSK